MFSFGSLSACLSFLAAKCINNNNRHYYCICMMADSMSVHCLPRAEVQKVAVASMLKGIDRYNPENLPTLESYIETQARENAYDLEANLAVLKLYQFNPSSYRSSIVQLILLKALTNLPHTDFVLCKCLIERQNLEAPEIKPITYLHDQLETCQFLLFWKTIETIRTFGTITEPSGDKKELMAPIPVNSITGFNDSIQKFICHVVNITYQRIEKHVLSEFLGGLPDYLLSPWMNKYNWKELPDRIILVGNQEESIKTKNITEKIEFESVAAIMSASR